MATIRKNQVEFCNLETGKVYPGVSSVTVFAKQIGRTHRGLFSVFSGETMSNRGWGLTLESYREVAGKKHRGLPISCPRCDLTWVNRISRAAHFKVHHRMTREETWQTNKREERVENIPLPSPLQAVSGDPRTSGGIYQIRNLINGKFYVGSTMRFERRWWDHQEKLRKGNHVNAHLQASWNKHGEESFVFEVLEVLPEPTKEVLALREQEVLNGVWDGGSRCYNLARVTDRPDSDANKKSVLQLDPKTREVIRRFEGIVDAAEEVGSLPANIGDACKGRLITSGGWGWVYEDDNLRNQHTPRPKVGRKTRGIHEVSLSGEVLKTWSSLKEATLDTGVLYPNIIGVCSGRRSNASGRFFRYADGTSPEPDPGSTPFRCLVCSLPQRNLRSLATHIQKAHQTTTRDYTIQHHRFDKKPPSCEVFGCERTPRYVRFGWLSRCREHNILARGGPTCYPSLQ